ncbi:putative trans-cinnamate 4-monooxygenase [Helianthus anomalus]
MFMMTEVGEQKSMDNKQLKCAIDHIQEAMEKGEINEVNVLYIAENINVAGMLLNSLHFDFIFRYKHKGC